MPCGRCIECKKQRRLEWSNRLVAERQYWNDAAFITLTYRDDCLPYSLQPSDLQKYFKRVRRDLPSSRPIKYFACGEYSPRQRPHYHAIVFGLSPVKDRDLIKENWPYCDWNALEQTERGRKAIGDVTFGSCFYVAGYIMKKMIGKKAEEDYKAEGRCAPFVRMSQGLSLQFIKDNAEILRNNLTFGVGGYRNKLPRYFADKLEIDKQAMGIAIQLQKAERIRQVYERSPWIKNSQDALRVAEIEDHSAYNKEYQRRIYQRRIDSEALNDMYSRGEIF